MRKLMLCLVALPLLAVNAQAETLTLDPVVVTATRTETPLSQIGSSVTVITAEEIEEKQQKRVVDILRSIPGTSIVQSGPQGTATSIHLRGTDTRHTLVMIDGVEYRDASSPDGGPDLDNLSTDNIERIEIVHGAQSVLYGSDAIGGIINIITKRGAKNPEGYASIEGGSYNTWIEKAGFSAGNDIVSASFSMSRTDSDGFSAANEKDGNSEDDGYSNTTTTFGLSIFPTERAKFNINIHHSDTESDYDAFGPVDGDYVQDTEMLTARLGGQIEVIKERWLLDFGIAVTDKNRVSTGPAYSDGYEYNGKTVKMDMQNTFHIGQNNTIVIGGETETEEMDSFSYLGDYSAWPDVTYTPFSYDEDARNNALFAQEQFTLDNFSVAVGVRHDHHSQFGGETTWRLAPTYTLSATKTQFKGSVGTGFNAPSLYQLYGQLPPYNVGNEDLKPETSLGWDVGVEQPLFSNQAIVSVTYFNNDIDDYIDYDYTDGYINIEGLKTQGVESTIEWFPCTFCDFLIGYTYTDTEANDGSRKARIPQHKGSLGLNVYPSDSLQLSANILYTGKRDDGATDETLDAYTLVNLSGSYQICDYAKLFARIDNLFDEDYEEAAGFGTAGLSAYAGVKVTF